MQTIVPHIDENISLPANAAEALPDLSVHEELDMRARTVKLLSDLTGEPIEPTQEDQDQATTLARQMMQDPQLRPDFAKYPNEVMAYLAGMVAQTNCMLVDELSDLKLYVVNKLIYEVEHAKSAKERISALTKLGEIDGVDAFKKRTEMTVKVQSIEEVEKELLTVLDDIEYSVVETPAEEDGSGDSFSDEDECTSPN
jgi:hypothetical protein